MYYKFAPDRWSWREVFCTARSEGIVSSATGVVWIILIVVQNDREKIQKQKQKNIAGGPCH